MGEVITLFNTLQTIPLTYCLYWVNIVSEMFIARIELTLINL
mgnify:CR=1 FL=1